MRRRLPDRRRKWNDPDLKPIAHHHTKGWIEVSEQDRSGISNYNMNASIEPHWTRDPTYDLVGDKEFKEWKKKQLNK